MSLGARTYFRPASEAMMYWVGWERIRWSAERVSEGSVGGVGDGSGGR
jgi:hypothetical protein